MQVLFLKLWTVVHVGADANTVLGSCQIYSLKPLYFITFLKDFMFPRAQELLCSTLHCLRDPAL